MRMQRLLLGAISAALMTMWAAGARADSSLSGLTLPTMEVVGRVVWGEGWGRAPISLGGGVVEWRIASVLGVAVGGLAVVATSGAFPFLDEGARVTGAGFDGALRLYLRGRAVRGFSLGAAFGLVVAGGVALAMPRAELSYRFVRARHFTVRIGADVGGGVLWDTAPGDHRPGPGARPDRYPQDSIRGFLLMLGLSLGWTP